MIGVLSGLITGHIEIIVSPDRFHFIRKGSEKSFSTRIFLSNNDDNARVLGIGDHFNSKGIHYIEIELFKNKISKSRKFDMQECLDTFLREAIYQVVGRKYFVTPQLKFRGSHSLNHLLSGYQNAILKTAALNAGARSCVFED